MTTSDSSSHLQLPSENPLRADVAPLGFTEQPLACNVSSEDVYRVMDGYFEGLDGRQNLATHIEDCDCCTDVFQFQLGLRSVIGTGCREELPPDVRQRVLDSLNKLI